MIAERRGWEEEGRRKERSRMRAVTAQESVCECVCVLVGGRCGSVCMTSQRFSRVYVLILDVNQIQFELKLTL